MRRDVRLLVASTLLAAFVFSLESVAQEKAQEKKPEPAPAGAPPAAPPTAPPGAAPVANPQQQDRIDIGNILDSWYKIYQKDGVVGYAHEVLARARQGNPYRYSYTADSEVELMVPDPKDSKKQIQRTESVTMKAQLDDTYAPLNVERRDIRDEATVETKVVTEESARRIDVNFGSDRKTFPVSSDEEVHYSRFLMFISLRQNGKLSKPGTQRALLLEPRSDDQSPIAEVQLEVHEVVKKAYLDKKEVSVTRVSYLKPPPASSRDAELMEAFVDKFGRIVEESTRAGVRRVLVKDEVEAVGQNERVRHGGRRDPMRKDLAMAPVGIKGGGKDADAATAVPDNVAQALKEIEGLLEVLRKAKEEKRDDEGQKTYDRLLVYFSTLRQMNGGPKPLSPVELARLETLRAQTEEIWGGLERLMKTLRGLYVQVTDAFNRDECGSMEKGIEDLKKAAATRKELEDTPQLTQVLKWIGELEPLVNKCKTRIELGRKKLVLTGTMLHEDVQILPLDASMNLFGVFVGGVQDVRFTKPNRIAVINEKMYRVGDTVEGEGVRVEKIWAFGIQVSLREETRDVGIRQK
jgi:hypothetical protein